MQDTTNNQYKEGYKELSALKFACAQHLDKHRRTLVLEWIKQLRIRLNLPTSSNLPDPAYTALNYRALDLLFKKLLGALRQNDLQELIPEFVANHHEVLDHNRSLIPLLVKIETLGMLVRRSIIADPTIPSVPALYFFDRIFSTLTVDALALFGERRRGAFRRLTDQYKQEAQAIRSVLGSCPIGILVTDRAGYIIHFNSVQEAIAKKPAARVIGKRLYHDYAYRNADEFREAFRRAIELGETAQFNRRKYESSTGTQYLNVTLAPVRDEHGNITGVVQMLEDVTARVDLEERLRNQNRDLTTRLSELEEAYAYIGRINRQFASLVDINTTLSSKISLDKMLDFIVRSAAMLTRARLTTLRLLQGKDLILTAQYGIEPGLINRYRRLPVDRSIIGKVIREDRKLLIDNLVQNSDFYYPELRQKLNLKQLVAVPLRSRGRIIGVLSIHTQEQRELSMHEQNFLVALANQAALAIDLEKALYTVRADKQRHERFNQSVPQTNRPRSQFDVDQRELDEHINLDEQLVEKASLPLEPDPTTVEAHYDPIRYQKS